MPKRLIDSKDSIIIKNCHHKGVEGMEEYQEIIFRTVFKDKTTEYKARLPWDAPLFREDAIDIATAIHDGLMSMGFMETTVKEFLGEV